MNHSIPLKNVDNDQRTEYSNDLRNVGNNFYKSENYDSAMTAYKGALYWASISNESDRNQRLKLQGQIFGNLSAIHFQRKCYELSIACTTRVTEIAAKQPDVVKNINSILIRRADALTFLNQFEQAKEDIAGIKNATEREQKRIQTIATKIESKTKGR